MARAFSDDLRCRILTAYEEGSESLKAVAQRFRVGLGYVKKIRKQQLKSGCKERPVGQRHGPQPRITPELEGHLRGWLQEQSDLTLEELQTRLLKQDGVRVCASVLSEYLKGMGLPRKKNATRLRTRHAGRATAAPGVARAGADMGGSPTGLSR